MATELLQDYAFDQLSLAVMATANSVTGNAPSASAGSDGAGGGEGSFYDVFRRKMSKFQDVLQGIAAPLKRRSMYEELPEPVLPRPEHIEMSHLEENRKGRGHVFLPCQLNNPTWCDYCGDFIWGLYKSCVRCQNCHLTSHEHCVPSVTLDCITVSEDGGGTGAGKGSAGGDGQQQQGPGLPSSGPRASLETTRSPGPPHTGPGCAKSVLTPIPDNDAPTTATVTTTTNNTSQYHHNTAPKSQTMSRTRSLPECHHHLNQPPHHPLQQQQSCYQDDSLKGENYNFNQRHSSSPCLQGLPPPPSAIDELTQGNDDARFITSSHQHHHQSPPPPPPSTTHTAANAQPSQPYPAQQQSPPSIPPTIQECPPGPTTHVPPPAQTTMNSSHVSDDSTSTSSLSVKLDGEAEEKDETDSGYRSGTIPDDKLPQVPSQATLDRQELKRKITKYNHFVPAASFEMTGKHSFQGFIKVTMNLIRPITMELGARPPSIYELLTREHIIEENTQQVAFYMPRDTHKSLHIDNDTTTREVISSLLKKFHILDHPRKFAMYEQEFNDKNKLVRLRRLADKNHPLEAALAWDPERIKDYRMVLQENETGEIVWEAFSLPELGNFLKVLDREERETIQELRHKYKYMRQIMDKRLTEFKTGKILAKSKSSDC